MFKGSIVAIITPMKQGVEPDTELDLEGLGRLIEFHIENGTDAIVSMGTTGESATLMEKEHCFVIEKTVEFVNGRVPVIAGTGANSTLEAINLTRCAKDSGADACLLVTPYYNKPTQEGLYQHFKVIAEEVSIPQILYNVPSRTACDMVPETVARLSELSNIVGIKEATGEVGRVKQIRDLCHEEFLLYSGDDATACEFMIAGGNGVISVTANVAPRAMHDMSIEAISGDADRARDLDSRLEGLHKWLFAEANPIPAKWAVSRLGLIENGIRLPLTWLSDEYQDDVEAAMKLAEVI
ncbi:MAG: 4-hydroxy-tetrahydrodipicolinate synthase [Gammaproteobacteria bacterium]|nr:4-hydroxy-tetrahydrodipicolinate synthase [Gammaproteobacteria bacterium]